MQIKLSSQSSYMYGINQIAFDRNFTPAFENLKIYGEIREKGNLSIFSKRIQFWDQINLTFSDSKLKQNLNLIPNENIERETRSYEFLIEYEIDNCSKWEYFKNEIIQNQT